MMALVMEGEAEETLDTVIIMERETLDTVIIMEGKALGMDMDMVMDLEVMGQLMHCLKVETNGTTVGLSTPLARRHGPRDGQNGQDGQVLK